MDLARRKSARVLLALPVHVRGMSTDRTFFDDPTETILISQHGCMTRITSLVDLGMEVQVVNTKNDVAGTFRVVWVNTEARDGFYYLGLLLLRAESDIWGLHFPPTRSAEEEATVEAWLDCQRCGQQLLGAVPLSEAEYLGRGVLVARNCEKCRSLTAWTYAEQVETESAMALAASSYAASLAPGTLLAGNEPVFDQPTQAANAQRQRATNDRAKNRAPLRMRIKVIRDTYGTVMEDICDTIDVSRTGARFLSSHHYSVGEAVRVILPYEEATMDLPVRAKVVRIERTKDVFNPVAIQMEQTVYVPGLVDHAPPAPAPTKRVELRGRSRVPLKFPIKIIRERFGKTFEDSGETINISRTGACFQTAQSYEVGETVQVIVPYKQGDVAIPVSARVVRQNAMPGSMNHAVAIRMGDGK